MKTLKRLTSIFFVASSLVFTSLGNEAFSNRGEVLAQTTQQGVVFDPPSNVRSSPNGPILCSVPSITQINIYGSSNGWYVTDVCGERGYIHSGQIHLQSSSSTGNQKSSRRIAEGLYQVGWESYIEVKGNQYRTTAEGDNGPWQPISNLKYVSKGVLVFSENQRKFYACDKKIYPYPVQQGDDLICSPNGWRKIR